MLISIVCIITIGTLFSTGIGIVTVDDAWFLFECYCGVFVPLTIYGLAQDKKHNNEFVSRKLAMRKSLAQIARKYNAVIELLENEYSLEKSNLGLFNSHNKELLRESYEQKYKKNKNAYEAERRNFLNASVLTTTSSKRFKRFWTIFITIGVLAEIVACGCTASSIPNTKPEPTTHKETATYGGEEAYTAWNAQNIPMPHLDYGYSYVSNPDNVVSPHTEQQLNKLLRRMDDSLQIESAMIIVNHVENGDPFRMAQDIFDRYKVGKNDRGMVIVLAYKDHKVRTHTGRALEADLTDIECSRLQHTYAIPFLKSEQPDSGMIYLTEAIYNTLKKKDLPLTYSQQLEEQSDAFAGIIALYIMLFGGWTILIGYLYNRYSMNIGNRLLKSNPFAPAPPVFIPIGGGRSGGFGGGSFGGGGGFSGGSSGGGGATSSW